MAPLVHRRAGWDEHLDLDPMVVEYRGNQLGRAGLPYGIGGHFREPVVGNHPNRLNADLISFRPPRDVQAAILDGADRTGLRFHRIEDAHGAVNLDFYPVLIERLPTINGQTWSAEQLLGHIRLHLNDFVDNSYGTVEAYSEPSKLRWQSGNPTGAVMTWNLASPPPGCVWSGIDDGSVAVTEAGPLHWIFTSVETQDDFKHPVSGNREFGIEPQTDGRYLFYTRAADRTTGHADLLLDKTAFEGGDKIWRSVQDGVARFVNAYGGSASALPEFSQRHDWVAISASSFHPTVEWLGSRDGATILAVQPPDPGSSYTPGPESDPDICEPPDPSKDYTPMPALGGVASSGAYAFMDQDFTPLPGADVDLAQGANGADWYGAPDPGRDYTPGAADFPPSDQMLGFTSDSQDQEEHTSELQSQR